MNFLLIDLNNYFSRFYYANKDSCIERYLKLIKDSINTYSPSYICNCIDAKVSFRYELYPKYKANREPKPPEYYELLENLKFNLKKFKYPIQTSKSLEAEDLIGLFIQNVENINFVVLSNDKDCLQLQQNNVRIFDYFNKRNSFGEFQLFVEKSVVEFGSVEQFTLYLSLRGDSSDNIPGVKNCGDVKARQIIVEYQNYDRLIEMLETNWKNNLLNMIRNDLDNFKLSYKLVQLYKNNWEFDLEKYKCLI